ncbi:hypothetical protein BGZ81_004916 [Podila clonocystis]|nr:hypothetical protein BGZ81_004916 [Podila clonocystis]
MSDTYDSTLTHRMVSSKHITLFGIRDGESISQAFSVKIDLSDTVDDLKKLIKAAKRPELDHIPADNLRLCAVCIPYGPEVAKKRVCLSTQVVNQSLNPFETMWDVFGESVPRNMVHFVIEATQMSPEDANVVGLKIGVYLSIAFALYLYLFVWK